MGGGKGRKGEMNGAQIELCILLCLVYVSWGLTDSIQVVPAKSFPARQPFYWNKISTQAPFYPIEATAKGATASQYGLVRNILNIILHSSRYWTVNFTSEIWILYFSEIKKKRNNKPILNFTWFWSIYCPEYYSSLHVSGVWDNSPCHVHCKSNLWTFPPTSWAPQGLQLWGNICQN